MIESVMTSWNRGAKEVFVFRHAMAGRRGFPEFVWGSALEDSCECLKISVFILELAMVENSQMQ